MRKESISNLINLLLIDDVQNSTCELCERIASIVSEACHCYSFIYQYNKLIKLLTPVTCVIYQQEPPPPLHQVVKNVIMVSEALNSSNVYNFKVLFVNYKMINHKAYNLYFKAYHNAYNLCLIYKKSLSSYVTLLTPTESRLFPADYRKETS